jgi:hypothetical protein
MQSVTSAQPGAIGGSKSKSPAKVSALPGRSALDGELMSRVVTSADRDAFKCACGALCTSSEGLVDASRRRRLDE